MNKLTLVAFCSTLFLSSAAALAQTSPSVSNPIITQNSRSAVAPQINTLSRADSRALNQLAESNAGTIATGRMALDKSQNPQVKAYAQLMVDGHIKAQTELRTLASSKGLAIPNDAELASKAPDHGLARKSGTEFDEDYAKNVGAKDHGRTLKILEKARRETRDPDIKALTVKMISEVEGHLRMAANLPGVQKTSAKVMKTHEKDSAKTAKILDRDEYKAR